MIAMGAAGVIFARRLGAQAARHSGKLLGAPPSQYARAYWWAGVAFLVAGVLVLFDWLPGKR